MSKLLIGQNIKAGIREFIEQNSSLVIFSPYIQSNALRKINSTSNIKAIVVAWHKEDLLKGVSDLDLYEYCVENGIQLYRNPKIHLKVLWNYKYQIILGSANITHRGLGISDNSNLELSAAIYEVDEDTRDYLLDILSSSTLVTEDTYNAIKLQLELETISLSSIDDFEIEETQIDYFLTSQLPQSFSPKEFLEGVKNPSQLSDFERECYLNDLSTYRIKYQSDEQFLSDLNRKFNHHPFILKFKNFIDKNESMRYGGVVDWIRENTNDVPIPRSFELKRDGVVNILYRWITELDSNYEVYRPNYSEVLRRKSS
jgi:hypothetical protein